jgi:LysR family transcriptional regulator for metE and metH
MELTEAILELVKAGQGIAVLAGWAAEAALRSGEIVVRPLTRSGIARQWSAATIRRRSRPAYLAAFISVLACAPTRRRRGFAVAV